MNTYLVYPSARFHYVIHGKAHILKRGKTVCGMERFVRSGAAFYARRTTAAEVRAHKLDVCKLCSRRSTSK